MKSTLISTKTVLTAAVFAGGLTLVSQTASAMPAEVTNGNDTGAGSLRAALESGARDIVVVTDQDIMITTPLTYSGTRPLSITGRGQAVVTMENINLLEISEGANLTVSGLSFMGPGGFDINNQSPPGETAGKGIFVDVRSDQTGTVKLVLRDVIVSGVANHGVHVSDCDLADDCGSGGGGAGGGSDARIVVEFDSVVIDDVGQGKFDADGLRVDERGPGEIIFTASNSTFTGVGADGVELDEGQDGGVRATVSNSSFASNGDYCDPAILEPELEAFLSGADAEGEFEESEGISAADLPGPPQGFSDNSCIEFAVDSYDSGAVEAYEYAIDVDDGFDVDEAGSGGLIATITNSSITDNFDEGIDFDEEDAGAIVVTFVETTASGNTDDGYKMSEAGAGGVIGLVAGASAMDNGGKGFVFEEEDAGGLFVKVFDTMTSDNDDSDDTGIEAVQEDEGTGRLTVSGSSIGDGLDLDGVVLIQD